MQAIRRIPVPIWLYLLAVLVRLIPVVAARGMGIGLDDMFQYDMLARSLAAGDGYRWYAEDDLALAERYFPFEAVIGDYDPRGVLTSFRPPGYPFFLAVIYRISGLESRFFAARLIQVFVFSAIVPLTWALARRLFPDQPRLPGTAGLILAFYPYLVVYPLALASEVTFIPLTLAAVLALLHAVESRRWLLYLLSGTLFGAAALTRSVIVLILPLILLWLWFLVRDRRGALILLGCVLAFVLPWMARNTRLHGQFTSIENNLGYTLYLGYHPETGGRFQYPQSTDLLPYLDDSQRNQIGIERTLAFIRQDPNRIPGLMAAKLGDFFGLERRALTYFYANNFFGYIPQPWFTLLFAFFTFPFAAVCLGAALAVSALEWNRRRILIALIFLAYLAPHLLLLAEPRFHLTVVPLLAVFAAYPLTAWHQVRAALLRPRAGWRTALAALLVGLFVLNWGLELWHDAGLLRELFGPEGNRLYLDY
jgi:4-amino-4-deoxy-L-arabinose transferase-like glycosyltransferase